MKEIATFEDLLQALGGFGPFQIFILISIFYPEIPGGTISILPVYTGAIPENFTCIDDDAKQFIVHQNDSCQCEESVKGIRHESIVSEWLLICDKVWVSDFITSIQMVGFLVGGILASQISDVIGRKKAFYIFGLIMGLSAFISGFSPDAYMYAICRFFVGIGVSGIIAIANIYTIEFLPPNNRVLCGACGPWGEGIMLIALFAYFFQTWRILSVISSLPAFVIFLSFPWLPESPRWLLQKGRREEAKKVFQQIERWNKFRLFKSSKNDENKNESQIKPEEIDYEKVLLVLENQCRPRGVEGDRWMLFKSRVLRKKLFLFIGCWFSVSIIYNGLTFNIKNLEGNPHMNIVYMGGVDSVAFALSAYFNQKLGRKLALMIYMGLSCASLLSVVLMEINIGIPYDSNWVIVMSLAGEFFNCGAWSAIKCFTAESFPTSVRSTAIGIGNFSASLAGIIAPQIIFLGTYYLRSAPFYCFGGLGLIAIILSFFLEETKGKPINESMENIL